ncbi:hypothetical protein BH09BAC3_BH09BAC3_26740 [soil metagenome]
MATIGFGSWTEKCKPAKRVDRKSKYNSEFSPLTVYNKATSYISADGGEKKYKRRTEKEIGVRGQFTTRGDSSPLTGWTLNSNAERWTEKH